MAVIDGINYNDPEEYKQQIIQAEREYIDVMGSPDALENSDAFNGLISYIYVNVFKPDKRTRKYKANSYQGVTAYTVIDTSDASTILDIWELYKLLCGKYKKTPLRHQFMSMIGLLETTFDKWKYGYSRNSSPDHLNLTKKIDDDFESSLVNKTVNGNSVSAMFVLKSVHGWKEDSGITVNVSAEITPDAAERIAARHAAATLPEKLTLMDEKAPVFIPEE